MRLEGKTALVTGASSGIGYAIGHRFGEEGAKVGLVANSQLEKAEELADKIVADGGDAFAVKVNLTDVEDIERLVDVALDKLG
ncbi:MAG: SDR family NAD(P)-dependent oxidoreductase, partial [Acidimicrobiia bacterium]